MQMPVRFGCTTHFVPVGHGNTSGCQCRKTVAALNRTPTTMTTASGPSQIIEPWRTAALLSS